MNTESLIKNIHKFESDIEGLNSSLETMENKVFEPIFKSRFGYNMLGSPCCDAKSYEEQVIMFEKMKDIGVNETALCLYIKEDNKGNMTLVDDNEMIDKSVKYCVDNNIWIPIIHLYVDQEIETVTSNFEANYTSMVNKVLDKYKNLDYRYFIVWNEATVRIKNETVKSTILKCMDNVKAKNKKVGIALMGTSPINYIDSSLFEKSDFICYNYYQAISDKYDRTTLEDGVNAWKNNGFLEMIDWTKRKYPDKEIIIGESGVVGSYECLSRPASNPNDWQSYDNNGRVCEIYFGGLFEVLKDTDVFGVYGWFPHDFVKHPEPVKRLYSKYFKGGM